MQNTTTAPRLTKAAVAQVLKATGHHESTGTTPGYCLRLRTHPQSGTIIYVRYLVPARGNGAGAAAYWATNPSVDLDKAQALRTWAEALAAAGYDALHAFGQVQVRLP